MTDQRDYSYLSLKQNIFYDISDNILLQAGYEFKTGYSDYLYHRNNQKETINDDGPKTGKDSVSVELNTEGTRFGSFISARYLILNNLILETGIRYDMTTYSNDNNISPRIGISYSPGENTSIKAAWGKYYQSDDLHDIETIDGENIFQPAQFAEHYVIGFEHFFDFGLHLRIDGYLKKLSSQKRDYRNYFPSQEMIAEGSNDRITIDYISGEASGIESLLEYKNDTFRFSLGYTYSIAEDKFRETQIHERAIPTTEIIFPRPYDQRHNFQMDMSYKIEDNWKFNLSWNYRTGWPYTEAILTNTEGENGNTYRYFVFESYNNMKFPDFSQFDLRINKYFQTGLGKINVFLEVINLFDTENVRLYAFQGRTDRTGNVSVEKIPRIWLPILPIFGISWTTEL